jgi:hypothetical protein
MATLHSFSAGNTEDYSDYEGGRYAMLLCRVAMGRIGKGGSSLRKPPDGFDAVSNSGNHVASESDIFAVFDNSQAYPEWIVYYD